MKKTRPIVTWEINHFWMVLKTLEWYLFPPVLMTLSSCIISDKLWNELLNEYWPSKDMKILFVIGTILVHFVLYVTMNGSFFIFSKYALLQKYKIPQAHEPPRELVKKTLIDFAVSTGIVEWVLIYSLLSLVMNEDEYRERKIPEISVRFVHFFLCYLWIEISFYFIHRTLHIPWFYKRVHRQHHEYVATIGIASEYAHWFEQLFSANIPTIVVPLLCKFHLWEWWIWLAFRLIDTYLDHSGYAFPLSVWALKSEYHEYHHSVNIGNYSGTPTLDYIFGTNNSWIKHHNKLRKEHSLKKEDP